MFHRQNRQTSFSATSKTNLFGTCSAVLFCRMSDKTPPKLITMGLFLNAAGQRAASPIHPYGRASRVAALGFDHAVMLLVAWGV